MIGRLAAALVIIIFLSGCTGPSTGAEDDRAVFYLDGGDGCPSWITECERSDTGNHYSAEGLASSGGPGGAPIGILVERLDGDLIIDGFSLKDRSSGILIAADDCAGCRIDIRNGEISAHGQAEALNGAHQGITVLGDDLEIHIENVSVDVAGGGHYNVSQPDPDVPASLIEKDGGGSGISIKGANSTVHLTALEIHASERSSRPGIRLSSNQDGPTDLVADTINISGFTEGFWSILWESRLKNITITDARYCMKIIAHGKIDITGLMLEECDEIGLEGSFYAGALIERFTINEGYLGALLAGGSLPSGLSRELNPPEEVVLRRGTVEDQARLGIFTTTGRFQVEDVTFSTNGGTDNLYGLVDPALVGGLATESVVAKITGSSFVDNEPYSLYTGNGNDIDATNNWWNDASGPRQKLGDDAPELDLLGQGELVVGRALVVPFLTEPP